MANLNISFCGVPFENPFTVAASPSSDSREKVRRALEAGWGGVVFKTTSMPAHSPRLAEPNMAGIPFQGRPQAAFYNIDLISERPIEQIQDDIAYFRQLFPDRRLIGSIMASDEKQWRTLVAKLEEAGADLIECSMSCPQGENSVAGDESHPSTVIPASNRKLMEQTTRTIKESAVNGTPVIVKMTPNVTDIVDVGRGAVDGGADALCAIDTVRGFIGLDVETGLPLLNIHGLSTWGGLSGPAVKPIALGCVSQLAKALPVELAGVGGVSSWQDAAEFLLLGARNVQVCTAISRYGFQMVRSMESGLREYLARKGYGSLDEMVGASLQYLVDFTQLDRNNHQQYSMDVERCVKCGACATACQDAGFGALRYEKGKFPELDEAACRGCGVCRSVCPKNCIALV